jgi:hypothetical protein
LRSRRARPPRGFGQERFAGRGEAHSLQYPFQQWSAEFDLEARDLL